MADFLDAALPWIIMGLFVAVATTYMNVKKNTKKDDKKNKR